MKAGYLVLILIFLNGCAGSLLHTAIHNFPGKDAVEKMTIGKTTMKDVKESYSGEREALTNNLTCLTYIQTKIKIRQTVLCFDQDKFLVSKNTTD